MALRVLARLLIAELEQEKTPLSPRARELVDEIRRTLNFGSPDKIVHFREGKVVKR